MMNKVFNRFIKFLNPKYWKQSKKDQIIIKIKSNLISNAFDIKKDEIVFLKEQILDKK